MEIQYNSDLILSRLMFEDKEGMILYVTSVYNLQSKGEWWFVEYHWDEIILLVSTLDHFHQNEEEDIIFAVYEELGINANFFVILSKL